QLIDLYQKMLRETDSAKQRALMRDFEKRVLDTEAHEMVMTYWNRIIPLRSYVKGWKIGPSHYLNQDLANVWLAKKGAAAPRSGSDAQDAQVYRKPGAAPDPDAGRSGGGRVCADAAYSRGHLRAPPRLRRHERQSARHRALSRRTRTRSPADRPVP